MKNLHLAIIIVLLLIIVFNKYNQKNKDIVHMQGTYSDYKLVKSYENGEVAVKLLNEVNTKLLVFFRYLKNKYKINTTYDGEEVKSQYPMTCRDIIDKILHNYNPEVIIENDPRNSNETSFTIAKGKELHLCLRKKNNPNELHSVDDLMFVVLHEISHMGNPNWDLDGHKTYFWTIFKFVLHEAKESGVYNPLDYENQPTTYCGLLVNYSPYYDTKLENLWINK